MTHKERKERPLYSGVLKYFPDALLEVANVSFIGNEQHNPGQPLHWAKEKSTDEADALMRHLLEAGTRDEDGSRHSAKVAWRALALLQREIDAEKAAARENDTSQKALHAEWQRMTDLLNAAEVSGGPFSAYGKFPGGVK